MKKILFLLITFSLTTLANNLNEEHQHSHHQHHSHEGHMHEMLVDGKKLEVDPIRFDSNSGNVLNLWSRLSYKSLSWYSSPS